ncbi:Ger(x)C family spore germination protein [Paenibacillus sp. J22TS3]|uniref:Ger(x)C family spore germination protein n=1 Tax=Paenibacillus sp. J22TS3 TaxID=2807192 RepID=UPI001B18627A|nr:Ger(x)C family spore germination protein [Paenibacillus sp. J22TS3]GIP22749.1 hypothetical protein J22TS3_30240 [Paenibacillus sp. J22TS3]
MKKAACMILALILFLPLQGCKFKDIDLKLFVMAIGIDVSDESPNKIKVTLKLAIPQGDPKKADEKVQMLTQESETIAEAVREMKSRVDKELDFGHCKALIFGEKYAKTSLRDALDWAMRRRDIQMMMYCAVGKPSAKEVLGVQPASERIPANSLFLALSRDGTESPFIVPVFFYNFKRRFDETGLDPLLPVIEAKSEQEFEISTVYLFNKQKIGYLMNPEETRFYNLLTTKNLLTNFNIKYNGSPYAYNVERSKASYKIKKTKDGEPYIEYKINLVAELEENKTENIVTEQFLNDLSAAAGADLNQKIQKALEKVQQSGSDPFGWGLRYAATHWNNRTEFKDWADMSERLKFKVNSKVFIKYTGMIR